MSKSKPSLPLSSIQSNALASTCAKGKTTRKPLRMFGEMATEFGLSSNELASHFSRATITPPLAQMRTKKGFWFDPIEMRRWWKAHKESLVIDTTAR